MKGLLTDNQSNKFQIGVIINRRFRRFLILSIPILALFALLILHFTKDQSESYTNHLSHTIKENIDYISDNYRGEDDQAFNITELKQHELDVKGYNLEPGNVQFKYVNPKNKKGDMAAVQRKHEELYDWVLNQEIHEPKDFDVSKIRPVNSQNDKANATIITLVRNNELRDICKTMDSFEEKFNRKFNYPYTFINDEPFSEEFKEEVKKHTKAETIFAIIPRKLWSKPLNIDRGKEQKAVQEMLNNKVAYADMDSYHNMCRFYSGNFYNLPELQNFKYYWRIEPDVRFYTDINYDIFKYMENTKKVYGFVVNVYDSPESVKSLWNETMKFLNMGDNYKYVNKKGSFQWLLNDLQYPEKNEIAGYSTCHFWSNFEIADMDFYRDEAYNEWFKYLDSTGKFYYERWGDAPVHSVGVALFADKSKVHWFRDVGYYHNPFFNCPNSPNKEMCKTGLFTNALLASENCMGSWIDYSIDDLEAIY